MTLKHELSNKKAEKIKISFFEGTDSYILEDVKFWLVAVALPVEVLDDGVLASQLVAQGGHRLLQHGHVAGQAGRDHLYNDNNNRYK